MAGKSVGYDMQIKLLTIGNSGVGKTCLLLRYSNNSFSPTFITTIGIDFKIKTITVDDKKIKLQIWDTAGQERFRTITTSYFRGAHGILLVFDVSDKGSFQSIQTWLSEIQKNADSHVNKVLIGNKCDVQDSARAVTRGEGEALAEQNGMMYFETSAKKGLGVNEAFESIARQVVERLGKEPKAADKARDVVDTGAKAGGGKKGCC